MTPRQHQSIREYREGIINRRSFVYLWGKEQRFISAIAKPYINFLLRYEEYKAKLASLFPDHKKEVYELADELQKKTYGLDWCYDHALTGKSWEEIKAMVKT